MSKANFFILYSFYPRWKTYAKVYGVSLPVVFVCTLAAFWMMLESIWKEKLMIEWTSEWPTEDFSWRLASLCLVSTPTVIYAVLVWFANQLYRKLATKLTEWGTTYIFFSTSVSQKRKPLIIYFLNDFVLQRTIVLNLNLSATELVNY